MSGPPQPKQPIRRFDVFAEYNKLEAQRDGRPLDEAKGYGLWLAKLVAGRRFRIGGPEPRDERERRGEAREEEEGKPERFRSLGGVEQTDALFDKEIVERMGEAFYREVFAPTLARHFARGDRYETIRDSIRKDWKP